MKRMHLSIITGNGGKFTQICEYLPDFVEAIQHDLDTPEIQTNLLTVISADKCKKAHKVVGGAVLVDDSGVYFDAFNQFPGALTKFFYDGVGLEGMQRIYEGVENRSATFESVLSYMDDSMDQPIQFIGQVQGTITFDYLDQADENPKLPYDLIFQPDGMDMPALFNMELWKSTYNHRVRAVKQFAERLESLQE